MKRCGAKNRAGGSCGRPAGWGTDHRGKGRCRLHGGRSGTLRHGRYSELRTESVADLVQQMEADPDPLDALAELALARAVLLDWVNRYTELREALFRWAANPSDHPRPARLPEIQEAGPLLDDISKAVARLQKVRSDQAISRGEFYRMMTAMGQIVNLCVDDPDVKRRIHDGWMEMNRA